MPKGLTIMEFWKGTERLGDWSSPYTRETQLKQNWAVPSAVVVAAVALQHKFSFSRNFREILGACQRRTHMFCRHRESIRPGSLWKVLGGVAGARCWQVPIVGHQISVFLLRRLCPCRRSSITSVHCWCWTPTMVCSVTTPLHSLHQVLQTTACGPNPTCEAISPGLKTHFANNEKIIYLRKICWIGIMYHIQIKSLCARCQTLELLCNSLCGPLPKNLESPGLYEFKRQHKRFDEVVTVEDCRINRSLCALRTNWCVDGSSQQGVQHAFDRFSAACNQAGTKISTINIEVLCLSRRPRQCILQVSGNTPQQVETFKYIRVVFTSDGSRNKEIDTRTGKANAILRELYCSVVAKRELSKTWALSF